MADRPRQAGTAAGETGPGSGEADVLGNIIPLRIQTGRDGRPVPLNPENCEPHTESPGGQIQWFEWSGRMRRTHNQRQCRGCGLWAIWEPKQASGHG